MSKKLYIQDYITFKITSGFWPAGSRIYSENQLAIKMQCSRLTVRTAMQELVYKGVLSVVHGKGYVVSNAHNIQKLVSFSITNAIDHVELVETALDNNVYKKLRIEGNNDNFLSFSKRYYRDGKLIAIQFTVLNRKIIWEKNLEGFRDSIVKELFRQGVPIVRTSISIKLTRDKPFNKFAKELGWNHEYPLEIIEARCKNGWVEKTIRITNKDAFEFSDITYSY